MNAVTFGENYVIVYDNSHQINEIKVYSAIHTTTLDNADALILNIFIFFKNLYITLHLTINSYKTLWISDLTLQKQQPRQVGRHSTTKNSPAP